jgi:chromosome segregation ATPase
MKKFEGYYNNLPANERAIKHALQTAFEAGQVHATLGDINPNLKHFTKEIKAAYAAGAKAGKDEPEPVNTGNEKLEAENEVLKNELESLKEKYETIETAIEASVKSEGSYEGMISNLNNEIETLKASYKIIEAYLKSYKEREKDNDVLVQDNNNEIAELKRKIIELTNENKALKSKVESKKIVRVRQSKKAKSL